MLKLKPFRSFHRVENQVNCQCQDLETNLYWEFGKFTSWDGESLESYYSRFYKMMNELVRNQCDVTNHQMNVQFLLQLQPEWQRFVTLVKQSQELKTVSYHKLYNILKQHQNEVNEIRDERLARTANPLALVLRLCRSMGFDVITARNMGMYQGNVRNRNEQRMQLITRKRCYFVNKRKLENWEHIICMAQIHEVTPDAVENSGPFFDVEPLQKGQNNNDNYNVFAIENEHPEQPESINDTYLEEQGNTNITTDSLDMCYDREQDDQDDADELAQEREIKDFKTKNKSLESSNNHFKEANNELSKTNQLMFKDLKKFQSELDKYHDVNYASNMAIDYAKAKGDLMCSTLSNTPLSSNSFAARRDNSIHRRLWCPKLDLVQGNITIKRFYYVEGINHNLFSIGQFCDADLEVAFRKSTCYIRDLNRNDLLTSSRGTDFYSITLQDTFALNPICLMAKATSSQAWLWHCRLSH
ncbi:hypothetical protein Tco_0466070 [Tanacetum coccineum]